MQINFFIGISGNLSRADKSAVCPINRHLHCHPERSEGSVALGSEMLRFAQHDRAVTHTDSWNNLLKGIIGLRWNSTIPIKKLNGIISKELLNYPGKDAQIFL